MKKQKRSKHDQSCDILVVGGGITGLLAAVSLAEVGFEVACVDAQPPQPEKAPELDGRTTALLQGAVRALSACGVWPLCIEAAEGLWVMRIIDESAGGDDPRTAVFDSRELDEAPFGYNVPNATLRNALIARLEALSNASHLAPAKLERLTFESQHAVAELADGRSISALLVVGADGRNSVCRESAGISARHWDYGQTAMAFSVAHTRSHRGISTEFHRPGGPFVLVPLPGNRSSVVWVERSRAVPGILELDDETFLHAAQQRTAGLLGKLTAVGPRFSYPVGSQLAEGYVSHRLALIGEAAHALPPIGAQGLNLGVTDVAALTEVLLDARRGGQDIGAEAILRDYESWRRPDVVARVFAVDALNRAVMARFPPLRMLRQLGLSLIDRVGPLKSALMRQGMAPVGRIPRMMRGEALPPVRQQHL